MNPPSNKWTPEDDQKLKHSSLLSFSFIYGCHLKSFEIGGEKLLTYIVNISKGYMLIYFLQDCYQRKILEAHPSQVYKKCTIP